MTDDTPKKTDDAQCRQARSDKFQVVTARSPRGTKRPLDASAEQSDEIACKPFSIVLTGGPCGGKSSILAVIRDRLRKRGMQVIAVPEYATHFFANSDGFQLDWVGTEKE